MSNWVLNQSSRRVVQVGLNFIGNIRNDELICLMRMTSFHVTKCTFMQKLQRSNDVP